VTTGVQILKNSLEYIKGELSLKEMILTKWPPAPEVLPLPPPREIPLLFPNVPTPSCCLSVRGACEVT